MLGFVRYSGGPSIVPVARYSARGIAWHILLYGINQRGSAVCGVISTGCRYSAGIVNWRIPALQRDHYRLYAQLITLQT